MNPAPTKIVVCMPIRDSVDGYAMRCLISLLNHYRNPAHPLFKCVFLENAIGMPVEIARNTLVMSAYQNVPDFTHILFVDDDMIYNSDALDRLLQHDKPVVGGLCHMRRPPFRPVGSRRYPAYMQLGDALQFVDDWESGELWSVDATGGAFLLIQRSVLDSCAHYGTWFQPMTGVGEDLSFCHRVIDAGYPIFVDPDTKIGHRGEVTITEAMYKRASDIPAPMFNRDTVDSVAERVNASADQKPVASVVIPFYVSPDRDMPTIDLKICQLRSAVRSAREQTVPVEVLVVLDGCSEDVIDLIDNIDGATRVLSHSTNRGIGAALNTGIRAASADFIAWLSADDLMFPEKVATQIASMSKRGFKASFHSFFLSRSANHHQALDECHVHPSMLGDQKEALASGCWINGSTTLIHRDVFSAVGLYNEELRYAQDWEMWRRIADRFTWNICPAILGVRREYGNLTSEIDTHGGEAVTPQQRRKLEEDEIVKAWRPAHD